MAEQLEHDFDEEPDDAEPLSLDEAAELRAWLDAVEGEQP